MITTRSRYALIAQMVLLAGAPLGLCSPSQAAELPRRSQPEAGKPTTAATQRAAKDIANIAIMDLQTTGDPDIAAYRTAALLLEAAYELSPDDEQILRLLIDAWSAAGDRDKVLEYTGKLVSLCARLKTIDTVSLLRLITGRISQLQDVDARLKEYERFLGKEWEQTLDDSIRSRLALDAALLLRESGDNDGFVRKLTLATTLDSTNKDAASLAVTYFSMQSSDSAGRLTLLINLLKADPFDSQTHLAIGRELAGGGAFEQARRFFLDYQVLAGRLEQRPTSSEVAEFQTIAWMLDGPDRLISLSRQQVEQERAAIAARRRAMLAEDPNAANLPDPEEYRLALEVERVRAAAAAALGDDALLDYASQELEGTFARRLSLLLDASKRPQEIPAEIAAVRGKETLAELMWMRLWIGRNFDGAVKILEDMEKDPDVKQESLARFQGWVRLRRGQLDEAKQILEPLAESDPLAALGLALIAEKKDDKTGAAEQYQGVYHRVPGTLAGAYAKTRAEVLTGSPPIPPPQSQKLSDLAAAEPDWLEQMISDPRRVFSLQAAPVQARIGSLESATVRLTITNVSPMPLGIGPDRPIQSSMLLAPRLTIAYKPVGVGNAANVVRIDRRLRLLPQETLQVDTWADAGVLGYLLDQTSVAPAEVRWRVLQGFSIDSHGMYTSGPSSVACDAPPLTRAASSKATLDPAGLVSFISTGAGDDVIEAMQVVRYNALTPRDPNDATTKAADDKLAGALAARFPSLNRESKLGLIATMPAPLLSPWMQPLYDAARADADPLVKLFALVATTHDPADEYLAGCAASENRRLAEVAALLKARLEDGQETYGRLGAPEPKPGPGTP
ncbi:MAG: hypothetical protein AB7G11_06705 [Phycisphaerales bacterium]